jgi:hypothetical protein
MLANFLKTALATQNPIEFIAASSTAQNTSSISIPTGTQPGDLVIVATFSDAAVTPSRPTGYTPGQSGAPESVGYMWAYKIMPSPVDTTASGLNQANGTGHIALTFRNVSTTTPLDVTPPTSAAGTSGMPNPPSVTTTNPGAVVIIGYLDDDIVTNTTAPSNWTLAVNATIGSSGNGGTLMAAYRITTTGGTYDAAAFGGNGTDDWIASTIPLRRA